MLDCPNLQVPTDIMAAVVMVESSFNPYAIGVVGDRLVRQPRSAEEAIATARRLERLGKNYSVGIAQVNRSNFQRMGINQAQKVFSTCDNLVAGSRILRECYDRAQDWNKAFSCYYSGNFTTGFRLGYVDKVNKALWKVKAGYSSIKILNTESNIKPDNNNFKSIDKLKGGEINSGVFSYMNSSKLNLVDTDSAFVF